MMSFPDFQSSLCKKSVEMARDRLVYTSICKKGNYTVNRRSEFYFLVLKMTIYSLTALV